MTRLSADESTAVKVFKALGDPTRFVMVRMLTEHEELGCADFAAAFRLSAPALSHHTRVLQECGLITMRKEGSHHFFQLQREQLARFAPSLATPLEPANP